MMHKEQSNSGMSGNVPQEKSTDTFEGVVLFVILIFDKGLLYVGIQRKAITK